MKVAFEMWWCHLEGAHHQTEVHTNHRNLKHLKTAWKLNQHQIRWLLFFAWFDFQVTYNPGGRNQRANALSQKPEHTHSEDKVLPQTMVLLEKFTATQTLVDFKEKIRKQRQQDSFMTARTAELDQLVVGQPSPWSWLEDLLHFQGRRGRGGTSPWISSQASQRLKGP